MQEIDRRRSRRRFLDLLKKVFAAGGLAALLGPIVSFFWPKTMEDVPSEPVVVGPSDMLPVGASTSVRFGRYPALVINTEAKGVVAYSAVCTHFACIVNWNPNSGMIECPCHAGFFDPLNGSVISGPPPAPLEEYSVFTINGVMYVGLKDHA